MKSFKQYINEALNPNQRSWVDWNVQTDPRVEDSTDTKFSDHVFGGPSSGLGRWDDKDTITIPFEHEGEHAEPSKNLKGVLSAAGYDIHDWHKGLAVRSNLPEGAKARPITISKVLHNSSDLQKKLSTGEVHRDDHRVAIKEYEKHAEVRANNPSDLRIMISRSPYHVAEQSTNKPWRSCLSLGTCPEIDDDYDGDGEMAKEGEHKRERAEAQAVRMGRPAPTAGQYYKKNIDDILGGSHVAYLVHKDDVNLKNPLARISLKPYHEIPRARQTTDDAPRRINIQDFNKQKKNQERHTILRALGKTYKRRALGDNDPLIASFENQIYKWSTGNFPTRENTRYMLDPMVQRDQGAQLYYG